VADHSGHLAPAEGPLDAPTDQDVGEQANAVETRATPSAMSTMAKTFMSGSGGEAVVPVADRGHGLDREVGRGERNPR
jgi:hypothetical protein